MTQTIDSITQQLLQGGDILADVLHLKIGACRLDLHSNSKILIDKLSLYFTACNVIGTQSNAAIRVTAIECDSPELDINFIPWKRDPGKTGHKNEYYDLKEARVLRKARTGMVCLQSMQQRIVAGQCIKNDNQVINYLNNQYMNWLQQQDWLICHASAFVHKGKGYAIAGFSGGGKSTLMLKLMDDSANLFLSNDRLFIKSSDSSSENSSDTLSENQVLMSGVPKLPRINPGTITANPVLHPLMSTQELASYKAMEKEDLWEIEQKYDVPIKQLYGDTRIQMNAPLQAFIILNWKRQSDEPVSLTKINIGERRDLLKAIMKSSGPFYQDKLEKFQIDEQLLDEDYYLEVLSKTSVYEVHGGVDFEKLTELFSNMITIA